MYDLFKKRALYSSVLIALLVLSGCSNSDGESSSTGGDVTLSSKASGPVVDGYIAGGHLYADLDGSKDENSGDITTTTDAQGNFSFGETTIAHGTYLYVTGGTDLATNTPFTGELSAYFFGDTTVISPLSTLIVSLMQNEGLSYAAAKARAATMMGLTEEQLVSDPFAEPIDTDVFIASQRIVSVANTLGGDFSTAVDALASSNMNIAAAAGALVPPVDPSDAEAVDAYLVDLEGQMPASATPDDLAAYQILLTDAISDPSNIPSADASAAVANAIACVTFDAIKGSNTAENNITTGLVLDSCEASNANVTFTWSSDNILLLDDSGSIVLPVYAGGNIDLSVIVTSDADTSVSTNKTFTLSVPRLNNHPPVAVADVNSTDEDTVVSFNVLANDTDEDGDALTLVAVSNGVGFSTDGTVNYTPVQDFNGAFMFTYTVKDSWNDEVNGTATVNVTAVNDAPILDVITEQTVVEDFVTATLDINASDVENDALTYSVVSVVPQLVNASFNGNQLDLASISNLNGDTNITVMVSDGDKNDTKIFTVHVTPVDDAPVISPISNPSPIDEDSGDLHVTYNVSDVDTSGLTLDVNSSDDTVATVVIVGSDIVITPQVDKFGTVTITLSADDGVNTQVTRSFDVIIDPVDDAPVLDPLAAKTIDEDSGTYNIWPSPHATDIDNDDAGITYSIVSSDTSILTTNGLQYTTVLDAYGTVDINVTATSNGLTDSKIMTVTVRAIDDAPVIAPINDITVAEDSVITVTPSATDVDNNNSDITFTYVSSNPSVVSDGTAISTVTDANGVATITVTAHSNGRAASTDFNVTVTAVNDTPTAENFNVPISTSNLLGNVIDLTAHISDVEGNDLNITAFDALDGLSKLTDTSFNFDSNGTEGSFSVNYTVTDAGGLTASGVMTITVSATPIYPEANPLVASMQEDTSLSIDLLTPNVDATSIVSASGTDGVVTTETNGTITFTPTTNFNGTTVINYTVASDTADQNSSTVTVTVNNVNDAPVIQVLTPTPILLTESDAIDQNISVDLNITDADGDAFHINQIWSTGQVEVVNGYDLTHVDLHVPAYASGLSTISINVYDANNALSEIHFDVNVTAIASVPYNQVATLDIDLQQAETVYSAGILVLPDNEGYSFGSIVTPSDTNIATSSLRNTMVGNELVITPTDVGTTSLTLHIASELDGNVGADLTWIVHVYDSANVPPVAAPSEITVEADGSVQTMLDVHDANGDYLTFTYPTPPMNGTVLSVDGWNGQITYAAKNGFIGEDSFTYIAHDDQNASNEVTVTVHVIAAENNNDNNDQTSVPISLDTFNGYTALSADGVGMFQPEDKGDNGVVDMHLTKILTDEGSSVIHVYDNGVLAADLPFTYETSSDNTMSVDEDGDSVVDFVVKYLGTVTRTEIESDLNVTLLAGSAGYKLATMNPQADYDIWNEPVYADWNNTTNQGYNPYSSLDDYITDNTFDPNNPDWQHNIWIDGYEFMLESNGTIIRAVNYYDQANSQQDWYVTNPNAGSWQRVSVDVDGDGSDDDVVEIIPTAYGLTTVRLAMVDANDGYVHEGEYQSAGRSELEYWFDENTAYHIGNSIMNVDVNMSGVNFLDAHGEFESFNTLPTLSFVQDVGMYAIWADYNGTDYEINVHGLEFDSNGTLYMTDTQDGDSNFTYSFNTPDIATIDGIGVDGKVTANFTTAVELAEASGLPESVFGTNHQGYRFAHVESDGNGSVELRFDADTRDAVINYLQDQYTNNATTIAYGVESTIKRDVEAVAFTNDYMNRVEFSINTTTCDRNVSREYVWLNGTTGLNSSGDFVISDDPQTYTYLSTDGKIATVNDGSSDVYMVKVNEELNATELMTETHLFLPSTAHGYRITYMNLANGEGGSDVRLDDMTIEYLESYYNNNDILESMCGVPAP